MFILYCLLFDRESPKVAHAFEQQVIPNRKYILGDSRWQWVALVFKALLNVLYHTYNGLIFHRKTCTICDQ